MLNGTSFTLTEGSSATGGGLAATSDASLPSSLAMPRDPAAVWTWQLKAPRLQPPGPCLPRPPRLQVAQRLLQGRASHPLVLKLRRLCCLVGFLSNGVQLQLAEAGSHQPRFRH